jgi:hypothetical protein
MGRDRPITRLAAMPGTKLVTGLVGLAALAAAMAGCGSSADKTLDQADAQSLNAKVVAVENAVAAGNCENAQVAAQDFINAVNDLPDTATTATKDALREAGDSLKSLASDPTQCQQAGATGVGGAQPTTTTTTPPPTTSTPTTTTTTSTTSTTSTTTTKEAPPPENGNGNGNEGPGGDQGGGSGAGDSGSGGGAGGTGGTGGTGAGGIGKK